MNLTEEQIGQFTDKVKNVIDEVMEQKLSTVVGDVVAKETRAIVEKMRIERALFGQDRSGLDSDQKKSFTEMVKAAAGFKTKANEALISETDSRGGYLVPREVANAILRIAASVGLVLSQAQKWPMGSDAKDIPAYTGAFLEGEYLGVDAAGAVTGLTFDQASLLIKKWQLAFVVGNDLLADASVELADWLLALGGESLANMIDKQAFKGTGNPFVGVLEHAGVTVHTMPTGKDTFAEFDLDEASDAIGQVEESVLDGAAWYMHRTVWAKVRAKKDTAGNYVLPQGGAPSQQVIANNPTGGGTRPVGEIMGFPVFTSRHLPANSATAVSTKFIVFGNFKAAAYGDKGELTVAPHESGSFGGKEIALADQKALVLKHRHAFTIALPAAFVAVKTAAS